MVSCCKALNRAMLRSDQETTRRLLAAGARPPKRARASTVRSKMARLSDSIKRCVPMIYVPDVAAKIQHLAVASEVLSKTHVQMIERIFRPMPDLILPKTAQ